MAPPKELKQLTDYSWQLPLSFKKGMQVPATIYGTKKIVDEMDAGVFDQITNVACLPGIQKSAICMPDGHWGYGFPIGGVAAFDAKEGVISPGGVGFDINCGMRLLRTNLTIKEVQPKLKDLIDLLFRIVPAGVGSEGLLKPTKAQLNEVMVEGAGWCVKEGYGWESDLKAIEDEGAIKGADPAKVSSKALERGLNQLGTLGSGNHYLEVQVASSDVFEPAIAKQFGITEPDQVVVMFHCGSRGMGHQVGTDYMMQMLDAMPKHNITVPDRQLACAPFSSQEGQDYFAAMAAAANIAFANRQVILHRIREGFQKTFQQTPEELDMGMIYDVSHNIAKVEKYKIDGKMKSLVVHRKGATRSFGPGNPALASQFQKTGQPVILGGSMETGSCLLVGTKKSEEDAFGSTAHGSGRTMSRHQAMNTVTGKQLQQQLLKKGIYVRAVSMQGLAEEAGFAYKNITDVVDAVDRAGISKKVLALRPIGNVKG